MGSQLQRQQAIGVVESVKGASDVYAPVSGRVHRINEAAIDKPSLINKSPEEAGKRAEMQLLAQPGWRRMAV